jgi:pimeloyl-ACP methyl ester carboxylesterase
MFLYKKNYVSQLYYPYTPVTFLHAFPLNHLMWKSQFQVLKQNNIGYLAIDFPGFGQSEIVKKSMSMEDYADSIFDLLNELGISKSVFVCSSMGGYVAFALFRKHPKLFCGLVLANSRALADTEEAKQRRWSNLRELEKTGDPSVQIDNYVNKFITAETRKRNPGVEKQLHSMIQQASLEGFRQAQKAMANRKDSFELLKEMNFPTLMIAGERDELISIDEIRQMAKETTSARFQLIPHAAHISNMEKPEHFNKILIDFLKHLNLD